MKSKNKPLLSIGMIFRDDIHTLERCMKSLEPLRDAVPCELVMADTGSMDGSRAVAARYADVLFDFPWADDFAAARNAVMDRACGKWYFSVDADEWLDGDIAQLAGFLQTNGRGALEGFVRVRSYSGERLEEQNYIDGFLPRLLRMSTGLRYQGAVHEDWQFPSKQGQSKTVLPQTMLHHDGYIGLMGQRGAKKRARNRAILSAELEKAPKDLRLLMSYIDCSRKEEDCLACIQRAAALVEAKQPGWQRFGPPIFRYAVTHANENDMPELEEWAGRAVEWFPDSFFTRVDVAFVMFERCWKEKDYAGCVRWGGMFLKASQDLRGGQGDQEGLLYGSLLMGSPAWERNLRILLAVSYLRDGLLDQAWTFLEGIDGSALDVSQTRNLTLALLEFHAQTDRETGPLLMRLYDELCTPAPSQEQADQRRTTFWELAAGSFTKAYQDGREETHRPSCTLFAPLSGRHELGTAAAILKTTSADDIVRLLGTVKRWEALPASAVEHALEMGAAFPLPDKPLKLEEMDYLASGLLQKEALAVRHAEPSESWQSLAWARALVLAAVQSCQWQEEDAGLKLSRAFVKVEAAFLPRCYNAELFYEENIGLLPPMHRFGWYCVRAFAALDGGDAVEYVRLLRAGLSVSEGMKPMVEFLTKHTPELRTPSAELLALAEQVRTLLAACAPDDPAVEALKASPAYQKAACLIEGVDGGGLPS